MENFRQTFIRLTVIFLKFLFDLYTLLDALTFPAKRSYESDPLILVTSFSAHSLRTAERNDSQKYVCVRRLLRPQHLVKEKEKKKEDI